MYLYMWKQTKKRYAHYVNICVYIHTHMYALCCICWQTYIHACEYAYVVHTCVHICICAHIYIYMYIPAHPFVLVLVFEDVCSLLWFQTCGCFFCVCVCPCVCEYM